MGDMLPPALLAPSMANRVWNSLTDTTFAGIHQLQFFDLALLIPYFSILFVLSLYGLHRYEMIRGYLKHRKDLPTGPPSRFEQLPRITVQLPLYNERYVVARLLEEVSKL